MPIYYDLYENPPKANVKKKGYHARLVSEKTMTSEELIEKASKGTTLPPELMRHALTRIVEQLKTSMAQGCRVHIDDLGFFSPSLSISYSTDKRKTLPIVKANDVNFTPEADVKRYMASILTIQTVGMHQSPSHIVKEQLENLLREHFSETDTLTRSQLQQLCPALTRNQACDCLNQWVADKILKRVGPKNSPIYLKGNL